MSTLTNLKIAVPLLLSKAMKKDSPQRLKVNQFLAQQMGDQKGLWLKVGQMLALNPESWESFEGIPAGGEVSVIPKEEMLPFLEHLFEEQGLDLHQNFPSIKFPGIAASLSQVHDLTDSQGKNWVIKVKLPGIDEVVKNQLEMLGLIKKAGSLMSEKRQFAMDDYQKTFGESFDRELNYELERENIINCSELMTMTPSSYFPKLHPTIQGRNFIVMEKLEGIDFRSFSKEATTEEKSQLANLLTEQFITAYFALGKVQGDFHPGNFLIKREGQGLSIQWLDLGQTLSPSANERMALYLAISGALNGDALPLGGIFNAWDFDLNKLGHLSNRLPLLLHKFFAPILSTSSFNLSEWHLKKEVDEILGEDKWWFRTAGSSRFFLSIRQWIGLFSMLEELNVPIFFQGIWKKCEPKISQSLSGEEIKEVPLDGASFNDLAKTLRVKITKENGKDVEVTLPARAITEVIHFISPETLERMKEADVHLDKIILKALQNGLTPCTLVDYHDTEAHYQVSLE